MSLEATIKSVMEQKLSDGTVEKLVGEHIEKSISSAMNDLFRSYGDGTKLIEQKLKDVMLPEIEKHDFNEFVPKLDLIINEVLKSYDATGYKDTVQVFQKIAKKEVEPNQIFKLDELAQKYSEFVEMHVDTSGLEVEYEDGPRYEPVEYTVEFQETEKPSYSIYERGDLIFSCEHDESLNFAIPLQKWDREKSDQWEINIFSPMGIEEVKSFNDFQLFLAKLGHNNCKVDFSDDMCITDYVTPEEMPE